MDCRGKSVSGVGWEESEECGWGREGRVWVWGEGSVGVDWGGMSGVGVDMGDAWAAYVDACLQGTHGALTKPTNTRRQRHPEP